MVHLSSFTPAHDSMNSSSASLTDIARGVLTVARRRGIGYFGYLLFGVMWPRAAYRFGWGPEAPPIAQGLIAAMAEWRGRRLTAAQLEQAGLLAPAGAVAVTAPAIADVEQLMDAAHRAGITDLERAFKRLARDGGGRLRFMELADARHHRLGSVLFSAARDRDRVAFNARFGGQVLTEAEARRSLAERKAAVPEGYRDYAPIDFGGGLTVGRVASTDSGTGRWDFFNRDVVAAIVSGKRVLDLGSNNGSLPLMMARSGARQVVAVEFTPAIADFARLNARILGWRDIRAYDLEVVTADMRLFLTEDWGRFDVVTAFCSLYYLPLPDMAAVVRAAAAMAAVLVLQANDAIDNLPAKTADLRALMQQNGYPNVAVHAPRGFARPLLVGRV
jgi:2-polyprenyl-3-methyl-5-hydroxy-6-metoxy-1,4-benzoquinol methylase